MQHSNFSNVHVEFFVFCFTVALLRLVVGIRLKNPKKRGKKNDEHNITKFISWQRLDYVLYSVFKCFSPGVAGITAQHSTNTTRHMKISMLLFIEQKHTYLFKCIKHFHVMLVPWTVPTLPYTHCTL